MRCRCKRRNGPAWRFRDSEEFGQALDAAAERLGISATAVEKDYWVSEVLRVLACDFATDFIFKGGTSLSKGYRIVERFSGDIDILVHPGGRGPGTTDRLMKDMGQAAAAGIGGQAAPSGGSETGRLRSALADNLQVEPGASIPIDDQATLMLTRELP